MKRVRKTCFHCRIKNVYRWRRMTITTTTQQTTMTISTSSSHSTNGMNSGDYEGLWLGATSGFTRSFLNAYRLTNWIFVGNERQPPEWMRPHLDDVDSRNTYNCCDFTALEREDSDASVPCFLKWLHRQQNVGESRLRQIVVTVRPALVSTQTNAMAHQYGERLAQGLKLILQSTVNNIVAKSPNAITIIHLSSIAAVGHIQPHCLRSETTENDPASADLLYPYDRFKRKCEEDIELVSSSCNVQIQFTNIRSGAIFSADDPGCIQCQALALQAYNGPLLPQRIDCNSSRNVASLVYLILQGTRQQHQNPLKLRSVYYYTRPLHIHQPVPYGYFLQAYRQAYQIHWYINLPVWIIQGFVACFHGITNLLGFYVPYLESVDYLLQVTCNEHSFDMTAVQTDFPQLSILEETIKGCFQRRKNARL